jgi:DNA repair protein RecO (recombination protein O)
VPLYRDEAIVLRTQKLGEADRIVTLLTRNHGRVRAVGRGVRKTTSRIGARLEPFMHVDVQCHIGTSLDSVSQVETIAAHGADLSGDYQRWTAGTAMLETAERLTPEERESALPQFVLLVAGLRALAAGEHEPTLILDSYLLRSLSVAGWSPSFSDCARCGAAGPHRAFSIGGGGMVCADCRPPGSATPAASTVELLSALLTGNWLIADASEDRSRREASGLVAAFLQWHLERQVRSLAYVDRTTSAV